MLRNFDRDLTQSLVFPREQWENAIKKCFKDCEIEWRDDETSQLSFGSDCLIITKKGRKYSADVKTRDSSYYKCKLWPLEIVHHIYTDTYKSMKVKTKPGWLYNSTSDLIIFATKNCKEILEVCIFSLYPFKDEKYKSKYINMQNGWGETVFSNGKYQLTLNKLIDQNLIKGSANFYFYHDFNGDN